MLFSNGKVKVKNSARKVDKVITGLIVGTAVASMVGLSRTKKGKEVTNKMKVGVEKSYKKGKNMFGVFLVNVIHFFKKK